MREKAIKTELNVIAAITEALAGTNKAFIGCSGTLFNKEKEDWDRVDLIFDRVPYKLDILISYSH